MVLATMIQEAADTIRNVLNGTHYIQDGIGLIAVQSHQNP